MVDDAALGVLAAGAGARVATLTVDASLVDRALGVLQTLGTTGNVRVAAEIDWVANLLGGKQYHLRLE